MSQANAPTGGATGIAAPVLSARDERHSASLSGWLLLLATAFIVYGSLYPFSFVDPPAFSWRRLFTGNWWAGSRGDILANIALFLPYGFFGALYLTAKRKFRAAVLLMLAGILVASALQMAQVFLPGRTPAAGDALWNTVGMATGYLLGRYAAAAFAGRFSRGIPPWRLSDLVIVLGVVAFEWLPFIPTLDFQTFKDNIKPLFGADGISVPEMVLHAAVLFVGGFTLRSLFSPGARSLLLALLALSALIAGRAFFVSAGWEWNVLLGGLAGLMLTGLIWRGSEETRVWTFISVVLTALLMGGLWPFQLKTSPTAFGWIPFEGFLSGDPVATARGLIGQALLFFSLFALVERVRGALIATTLVFGLTALGIEFAQCYLYGRSGEITPVLLVVITAVLARLFHRAGETLAAREPWSGRVPPPRASKRGATAAVWQPAVALFCGIAVMAYVLSAVLHMSGMPYNVYELFRDGGGVFGLTLFSMALIFPGLGSRAIGWRLAQAHRPGLELPLLVLVAGALQLGLLSFSVTDESVADIAGSNNLYWFVTNRDIWGGWWKELFLSLNSPRMIGLFERIVRFAALLGPLVVVLAWLFAFSDRLRSESHLGYRWLASLTLSAFAVLWLCKFIAFDRSSTDNLNELIARDGFFGAGGGAYLYALLALVCLNVWAVALVPLKAPLYLVLAALFAMLSLPAGWALLQAGLEPQVEKYGSLFSGQQFLLGPDRKAPLPDAELMIRWWIVQAGIVAVSAFGARVGSALLASRNARDVWPEPS